MKIRFHQKSAALVAGLSIFLAACGGQSKKAGPLVTDVVEPGNYYSGTQPVYAHLVSNRDGSWTFTTVTASDAPSESAYLVRLNDLTPAFDTRVAECSPQVYPDAHRCNPINPFRDEDSGVLDKIISGGIAVGTAGKVKDISYGYETTFDEAAFNRAVDEALVNTDLDHRRLIAALTTYADELREARTALRIRNARQAEIYASSKQVELSIQPNVGGLTEYYQGDIDFTQLVDVAAVDMAPPPAAKLKSVSVLPCKARQCTAAVQAAIAALRTHVNSSMDEDPAAGTRPSVRTYNVQCDRATYGNYLVRTSCPAQIVVDDNQPVEVPLNVEILSRDFDRLYPAFDIDDPINDPALSIRIDGEVVTFQNLSEEYLTVSAQTMYYNSTVNTTAIPIDIPPGISVKRKIDSFVSQSTDIESRYLQMTPDKARRASFHFGFAVRYRLASQAAEQTLHASDTFNVDCVIRNRLHGVSCQPEALAEAAISQEAP